MKYRLYGLLVGALAGLLLGGCNFGLHSGRKHVFSVQPAPAFLTEELAIAKARETLAKEGYNPDEWEITRAHEGPSTAPDGTPDKYFRRFSFNPNAGRLTFIKGKRHRTHDVQLEDNRVICSAFYGL